ncbi:carbohydrate ABC transporter permease [Rarobacter faecitabidus]|uniref:Cellobiose ABC transporter membrane protein n=1 Tax=Rarobacter faecitabidus TaxID=13243 RepID=A0A542ZU23_RARFA|nr:carbohydrate ABC transporter permease [Rarobacter faecitabidus]TQL63855.1 cellobiose ABC transporter membrane protein [Rarobacter faecitabidus]
MSSSIPVIAQTVGPRAARREERRRGSARRPGWLTYAILTVFLLGSLYPLYYTFLLASADQQYIAQHAIPSLIPRGNFLSNVGKVLSNENVDLWLALRNSLTIAVITSVSVVFFATLAGYAFAKLRFRGRRGLLFCIIATMAVPTQLGVVPMFMIATKFEWQGSVIAVIVPGLVTAFGVFWMTQYLDSALPTELIEAARVDGCSMIRTFWSIALPAARPAATMLGLFTFIASWTNYLWPSIVLGSKNPTLPIAVQLLQTSLSKDYSQIMTGVLLTTVPLAILFVVAGRQLVSGIMQGAVKG